MHCLPQHALHVSDKDTALLHSHATTSDAHSLNAYSDPPQCRDKQSWEMTNKIAVQSARRQALVLLWQ